MQLFRKNLIPSQYDVIVCQAKGDKCGAGTELGSILQTKCAGGRGAWYCWLLLQCTHMHM